MINKIKKKIKRLNVGNTDFSKLIDRNRFSLGVYGGRRFFRKLQHCRREVKWVKLLSETSQICHFHIVVDQNPNRTNIRTL